MENRRTTHVVKSKFPKKFEEDNDDNGDVFRSSRTHYDDVFRNMGNPPTPEGEDAFPKKFDDYEEGYTFLSIGGKLPQIRAPLSDGDLEAGNCCGDSSTIAPEVAKPKEASGAVGKAVEFTEEEKRIINEPYSHSSTKKASGAGNAVDSKGDSSYSAEEEQKMINEFYSHLNVVGPYDIEMEPPECLHYPLIPLSLDFLEVYKKHEPGAYEQFSLGPAKFALQQINVKEELQI